jgi:hypothetical protein
VEFHDPHVPEAAMTREHAEFGGRKSTPLDREGLAGFDAVLISTDHNDVDYRLIAQHAKLVVNTPQRHGPSRSRGTVCGQGLTPCGQAPAGACHGFVRLTHRLLVFLEQTALQKR